MSKKKKDNKKDREYIGNTYITIPNASFGLTCKIKQLDNHIFDIIGIYGKFFDYSLILNS